MTLRIRSLLFFAFTAVLACGSDDPPAGDEDVSSSTADLSADATAEAALIAATLPPVDMLGDADGEAIAAAAAASLEAILEACATSQVAGTTVTWTLAGCSGDWAMATLDGTISATYRPIAGTVEATIAIDVVTEAGSSIMVDADVAYAMTDTGATLTVGSTAEGVGPRGADTTRSGDYTLRVAGDCLTLDGTWEGTRAANWTLTVSGYSICAGGCPSGSISRTGRITASVSFDGSDQATLTTGDGSETVTLACGA